MWHLISIIGLASKSPLTEVESQVSQEVLNLFCCLEEKSEEICKILQELHTALTRAKEPAGPAARGPQNFTDALKRYDLSAKGERPNEGNQFYRPRARPGSGNAQNSCPTCTFPASYPDLSPMHGNSLPQRKKELMFTEEESISRSPRRPSAWVGKMHGYLCSLQSLCRVLNTHIQGRAKRFRHV